MKFKKGERVVILDGMIKGKVVGYYNGEGKRIKVLTDTSREWCIKPEDLAHYIDKEKI